MKVFTGMVTNSQFIGDSRFVRPLVSVFQSIQIEGCSFLNGPNGAIAFFPSLLSAPPHLSVSIINSTFVNNSAEGSGGALWIGVKDYDRGG